MALPALVPLATSALARIGISVGGKGAIRGLLSKAGTLLGKLFWGNKFAAAGTGALAMSALSGGDSSAANSPANAQLQQYRA